MTRKKVNLAYIANDSARKATFKKRKKGLMKKVSELSTLCGIEACAIIYSPYDTEPEVWPSAMGARRAIARFRNMSEMDQSKRMVNQQAFLRQRIGKAEEQLKKQQRDNREKEVTQAMYQALTGPGLNLQGLSLLDLNDLGWVVDETIKEIDAKVKSLEKSPPAPPSNTNTTTTNTNNKSNSNNQSSQSSHQSFMGNTDQKSNEKNNDNKALDQSDEAVKSINNSLEVGMDGVQSQPWYMDLLKPSTEGLMGFSRFNSNNHTNNNDLVMPPPPPPLPPYPCPGQNVASWSNFFFP
ncbi:hypothetical protein CRG98_029597 [Punica granatum]|nr:hypothetical protein CRG98_029597 [Punica granatum]